MKTEEDLHSFAFEETINGGTHHFRITELGHRYAIEKDGIVTAEVAQLEQWQQVSGDPLDKGLLARIYDCIADHWN